MQFPGCPDPAKSFMTSDRPHVTIYTDGGADPNPGPGGWAAILIHESTRRVRELSGSEPFTTNNRMELTAAIRGLSALKQSCAVRLYTDSEYLQQGVTEWIKKWARSGWKRGRKKEPVENADLWQQLHVLTKQHKIVWQWIKGHAGDRFNERADFLARREIRKLYVDSGASQPADAEVFLLVSARPRVGLWAASVRYRGEEWMLVGQREGVTSNQLDLLSATAALSALPPGISVRVFSLSDYLRNGASQWIKGWKLRGWQTRDGKPVKNVDLWQQLDAELSTRRVEWPPAKGDQVLEATFEDLAYRAQEEFEQRGWGRDRRRNEGMDGGGADYDSD